MTKQKTDNALRVETSFSEFLKNNLSPAQIGILIGLSGGADSVVLTHLFNSFSQKHNIKLHALHINHMIRGDEAERDELFCKELCEKLNIPFWSVKINIPLESGKRKLGLEETARILRYDALYEMKSKLGDNYIALAHNASDNLETVIFNLARGAAGSGICGIPPVRDSIIRPLIAVSKADIIEYAAEKGYNYVTDSTNTDTAYTRNYIRHEIIPSLQKLNPEIENAVTRMTNTLRDDNIYLDALAQKHIEVDDVSVLASLDNVILRRVVKIKAKAHGSDIANYHITKITDLLKKSAVKYTRYEYIPLPSGVYASISDGKLSFESGKLQKPKPEAYCVELKLGINNLSDSAGLIYVSDSDERDLQLEELKKQFSSYYECSINFNLNKGLTAHPKADGDEIKIRGMTRKIKKILNEMKIPPSIRLEYPIIYSSNQAIWIPGYGNADFTSEKDKENCKLMLYYFFERKN